MNFLDKSVSGSSIYIAISSHDKKTVESPLESLLIYNIFKTCLPVDTNLFFVICPKRSDHFLIEVSPDINAQFLDYSMVPWQVSSCVLPVAIHNDTTITGLCAVARHICKFRTTKQFHGEHQDGLLGFRSSCLQAPNEVSIWTKFCEIDIIKTTKSILNGDIGNVFPVNLVRFENHLKKPVKLHNVYKVVQDLIKSSNKKTDSASCDLAPQNISINLESKSNDSTPNVRSSFVPLSTREEIEKRVSKQRKWKSTSNELCDCSLALENLQLSHQFAEGPFMTLADIILYPIYCIIFKFFKKEILQTYFPLTCIWFSSVEKIDGLNYVQNAIKVIPEYEIGKLEIPSVPDVSLYKSDPKRSNPKKRLFTKENDIVNALYVLEEGSEKHLSENNLYHQIDWSNIPPGANPLSGHLPDSRMIRKSQQLENLAMTCLKLANKGDIIVDFCSGSGHLGILIAYMLPSCKIVLLENKEQSLLRARTRVHEMGLKNVYFFQCNLDFFIGRFNIGVALHACGIASDLVLDKCLKANAKFVLCPCCYGSLHETDRFQYPRSKAFANMSSESFMCIGHAADQTHSDHPLTVRGSRCMAVIDSDRARLAEEFGYKVTLSRLQPLSCTPKNNLLVGII